MALVRYFAAAEERAGTAEETRSERTLSELRAAWEVEHPSLADILDRCSVLVDGVRTDGDAPLAEDTSVDVLPPFAGG